MKFLTTILSVTFAVFFFSCSNDSSSSSTNQVKDDFSYLSVNSSGQIQKIGNNTGKISPFSQIEGLKSEDFINLNTIASNSEKIFLINYIPPINKLYIFDRKTKTTRSKELVFPKEITGMEPTLTSLIWDENKKTLYGIIVDNPYINSPENSCYFIKINPDNLETNYEGLIFNQRASSTAFLNNGKVYSSFYTDGFTIEIDLENNTAKKILFNNSKISFLKASVYNNNTTYCLRVGENGYTILTKLDLNNNTYEDLLPNENFGTYPPLGNGFIDKSNNQYINYMLNNSQPCILKYNISTKTYTTLKVTSDTSINDNLLIIDKIPN